MSLLSMTDCSVADNRVQARHELDRAVAASGYTQMSAWAMKWGRALLDAGNASDDDSDTIDSLSSELHDAECRVSDLEIALNDAVTALDKIEASEEIRDSIDKIIANLENAL